MIRVPSRSAGLSLLETLIALFILLSAFTIILSLFLRSTDHQVNVQTKVFSVAFAETLLDDIKVWAADYDNFSGDWTSWSSVTLPEYPGYEAKVEVIKPRVPDPCTLLESDKPVADRTIMTESFRDITLVVFHEDVEQLSLQTRLAEPAREIKEVKIESRSGGTSLAPFAEAELEAMLLDTNDKVVSDVVFRWTVDSVTGNGSVSPQASDSSIGIVKNAYIGMDGLTRIVPGTCRVSASARYRGREYTGSFEFMELTP